MDSPTRTKPRTRRTSISAECLPSSPITSSSSASTSPTSIPPALLSSLRSTLSHHFLFASLTSDESWSNFANSLTPLKTSLNQRVLAQGEDGEALFIVHTGKFQAYKDSQMVMQYSQLGDIFGELALLYNAPRAATVVCIEEGEVWMLARNQFLLLNRTSHIERRRHMFEALSRIPCSGLTEVDLNFVADVMEEQTLMPGERFAANFFLVLKGHVDLEQGGRVRQGECHLNVKNEPCLPLIAPTTLGVIDGQSTNRLLGSLRILVGRSPRTSFTVAQREYETSVPSLQGQHFVDMEDYTLFLREPAPRLSARSRSLSAS